MNFSAVLCEHATRQDGVSVFVKKDAQALEEWLLQEGVQNIEDINQCLGPTHSWCSVPLKNAAASARRKGEGRP